MVTAAPPSAGVRVTVVSVSPPAITRFAPTPEATAIALGVETAGAGTYQAKSEPSPKPVVDHVDPTIGAVADTSTVYAPAAAPDRFTEVGSPAVRGMSVGGGER